MKPDDFRMIIGAPDILYHYTDSNALIRIVESRSVWATKIHYLNDSTEFDHAISIAKAIAWQRLQAAHNEREREIFTLLQQRMEQVSRINVFVSSFSEVSDSLTQWRGYCQDGAGYSLGFDGPLLTERASGQGFSIKPCVYEYDLQMRALGLLLDDALNSILSAPVPAPATEHPYAAEVGRFLEHFVQLAPTLKDPSFRDEREWRLVSGPIPTTDPRWNVRPGRSMLIPYVSILLSADSSSLPIKEVVVGPTPHMDLAMNALSSYLSSRRLSQWSVKRSQVPYRAW